ncbi:lipid II:glycine glycyltransferase FemX [Olivibacter domesticus]|uniref:Lipid II:glycine glycyltransferase (Peptidoglycan interpeptide bridge formation enzyme) n=1 Tax=Olivibacter domesticus TaxID=407022 RepID=A0A1H7HRQ9_OLID1|nr:peptidoglycan bridge formation glycyltransferase FemA/FemB family protein [Olivibacter domesticus]SEK53046.1 Lipid II:glycine glycyltransferase (Peptidoglycan interpeptide bridge formation enzyme) [Olivibacter domesticus]
MTLEVDKKETKHVFKTSIIQQTAFWSEVKQQQGVKTIAFDFKIHNTALYSSSIDASASYTTADILILLQRIDNEHTIAYVPYGPEIEPEEEYQGQFLEELSESLRPHLPAKCIMIRYDLAWQSHWATEPEHFDCQGNWHGPPEKKYQEFRLNFNTQNWNLQKANSDILPSNTIFLSLKKETSILLKQMKPKTRYNINLSVRKGVQVRDAGMDSLPIWYALYKDTAFRNKLYLNNIEYFRTVLSAQANDSTSPADVHLLIAEVDRVPLAAMFLVIANKRGTYLYGASATTQRNYMATYALQWKAMQIAKQKGCIEYDFFGVSPNPDPSHPMYGLFKFKSGFGGELYHRLGCWDYPLQSEQYTLFKVSEMSSQGYHL